MNSVGYRLLSKELQPLYTNLTVDINFSAQEPHCQVEGYLEARMESLGIGLNGSPSHLVSFLFFFFF